MTDFFDTDLGLGVTYTADLEGMETDSAATAAISVCVQTPKLREALAAVSSKQSRYEG